MFNEPCEERGTDTLSLPQRVERSVTETTS
jgi:hypothetical protein